MVIDGQDYFLSCNIFTFKIKYNTNITISQISLIASDIVILSVIPGLLIVGMVLKELAILE